MADEKVTAVAAEETKAKKSKAADKKSKKGGLIQKLREVKSEFKKIIWPTMPAVVRNTLITRVVCILLGAVVCLIDFGLAALVKLIVG